MHHKTARIAARTVAVGGIVALGLGSTQAAMAKPAPDRLGCSASDLSSTLSSVSPGGTIYLAADCTYRLGSGLTDDKADLTIVGDDSTLSRAPGASAFTILTVDAADTLTLDDVNFTNGGGGSPASDGGAIYNFAGNLIVNGGTFSDNHSGYYGGAINNEGSLTVSDAEFTGNTADLGGAIENGDSDTATISNSAFDQNGASDNYGGAVRNDGSADITFSSFLGNTGKDGGAIYNDDHLNTAENTLDGNRAYEGGGIYDENASLDDDGSLIMSNAATHLGGGIYNGSCVEMTLTGTTLLFNAVDNVYNHGDC